METKLWASIIIFFSGYVPLSIIIAVKDFNFQTLRVDHPITIMAIMAASFLSIVLLKLTINNISNTVGLPIKIKKIVPRSNDLITYTVPYVMSFIGIDLSCVNDWVALSILLILLCFLSINSQIIFINPLLLAMKYSLYDVEYEENKKIRNCVLTSNEKIEVDKNYNVENLSEYMKITVGVKNGKNSN